MRIVGGEWSGRRLVSPDARVRPTQDRVRQILFDILGESVTEGPVLDLYAGTGALGFEALSRGAPRAVFVEMNRRAVEVLERNREVLEAGDRARVVGLPVLRALGILEREQASFRYVLADPPYGARETEQVLEALGAEGSGLLPEGAGLVLEARATDPVPDRAGCLVRFRDRRAGDTVLHFYRREAPGGGTE